MEAKKHTPPIPAVVVWEDVHRMADETHISLSELDMGERFVFTHRCFIVAESQDAVWVCAALAEDGDSISDVNRIPRGCIHSIHLEGDD